MFVTVSAQNTRHRGTSLWHLYVVKCLASWFRCTNASVTILKRTEFDKQHACCGHGALSVGGHALEVACVCSVQVSDAEAWSVRCGSVRDPPRLLHHRGVVLQPAHGGWRVAGYATEKLCHVAQRGGDVVHGSFETDEEGPWKTWET